MSGLFGSSIVDMAIGLFFLYWLLSIICSSIWEMIAALLKLRAADLERGIANLVCDPRVFHAVMAHPAITAVGNTDAEMTLVQTLAGSQGVAGRPSYISARAFSLAFLDAIAPVQNGSNGLQAVRKQARDLIGVADVAVAALPARGTPAMAPPGGGALPAGEALVKVQDRLEAVLKDNLNAIPSSNRKTRLLEKLDSTKGGVADALRDGLKAPTWHPVRRAVVEAIDASAGCELYRWASGMHEKDALRRSILGSIEGKQRLGRFLLNITDRELGPLEREKLFTQLYTVVKDMPVGAARDAFEEALRRGDLEQLRAIAEKELPSPIAQRVFGTLDAAIQDLAALRTRIESWFDESMEHVSGIYKRRSKAWIFIVALLVTLPAGADSLRFVSTLYANPTLRDVLVREADQSVTAPTPAPTTAAAAPTPATVASANPTPTTNRLTASEAAKQLAELNQLFGFADQPEPFGSGGWMAWLATRVLGAILTAFAVSLGAPFWFDVLGKIVNVRSTGKAPSSTAGAASPAQSTTGPTPQSA
jgi:hypothetical protein